MIPQLVTVRAGRRRFFVPVLPVLLVLSPVLVLVVLAGIVACVAARFNPVTVLRVTGRLLWSLPGASFAVEQGRTAVLVSVR